MNKARAANPSNSNIFLSFHTESEIEGETTTVLVTTEPEDTIPTTEESVEGKHCIKIDLIDSISINNYETKRLKYTFSF